MKVLVTGGSGFTGKALVKRLIDEGNQVVALDNKEGLNSQEIRDWGAELVMGSVTDRELMNSLMKDVEVVYHIAAAFREMDLTHEEYRAINVGGTEIALEAAHKNGVRKFVYCSTCGVHGNIDQPPGDEQSPIQPADYYQRSKYDAEPIVRRYFDEKGLKTTIIRPAAIYGPGDPQRYRMIFRRVKKGMFPIFGSGQALYHPVYIDNLIDAFLLAGQEGKGDGEAYLIGDEHYLTIKELVREVGEALNVDVKTPHFPLTPLIIAGHVCEKVCKPFRIQPPIFPRRVDWFRQNRAFKIDKAKNELGYMPRVDLKEGLRRTAQWYQTQKLI